MPMRDDDPTIAGGQPNKFIDDVESRDDRILAAFFIVIPKYMDYFDLTFHRLAYDPDGAVMSVSDVIDGHVPEIPEITVQD